MLSNIVKAVRLEFSQVKSNKVGLTLLFVVPLTVLFVFSQVGSALISPTIAGLFGLPEQLVSFYKPTLYDFFAPGILVTLVLFVSMQLSILRIVGERSPYGTLERDLLAIGRTEMYLGKLLTNALVVLLQCLLIVFFVLFVVPVKQRAGDPMLLLLVLFLTALSGVTLGLLFSVLTKAKEDAVQLVPFSVLVLLLLSGFLLPLDLMSPSVKAVAEVAPLALANSALKSLMLEGKIFVDVINGLVLLLAWSLGFTLLGVIKFNLEK